MASSSTPLYSTAPRSEPSLSPDDHADVDEDGFITRPRRRTTLSDPQSPSPSPKRPRYSDVPPTPTKETAGYAGQNGGAYRSSDAPVSSQLALSILNVEPMDEFIREVADWIHACIREADPRSPSKIEVEAKVGILVTRGTRNRLSLPTMSETSESLSS